MTRVIHTGDTHIGYQQYHAPARRQDFLDAFERVAEDAVEDGVDAVVHAGDLFHDRRPDLQDLMGTLSVLRTLDDAGIPFLAVVGNHETKRDAQWLDLFESLGLATRLGDDPVVVGDTAFYGLDYVPRNRRDDLTYEFAPHDAAHAALVSHGLFEPFAHGDWDAAEVLTRATVDFDAMLLGDNHAPGTKEVADAWVTYCGSTERASTEERDERGYNLVTFEEDVHIARRGLPTRDFEFIDVELAEGEGTARVRERVREYDLLDAVAVVTIEGAGEPVTPASIEEAAREEGALVVRVTDRREVEEAADVEVSFADPDDAVRERVRELGLSEAARGIDETVRASKVADSNVADEVEARVREAVDDDPEALDAVAEADGADAAEDDPAEDDTAGTGTGDDAAGAESGTDAGPAEAETESETNPDAGAGTGSAGDDGQTSLGEHL